MNIDDLKADLEKGDFIYKGLCHDCGAHVEVEARVAEDGMITIEGGAVYKVKERNGCIYFFKCDTCFEGNPTLTDYVNCEVYSRVVGYLRPIQQWNKGKKAEYEMRKEFVNTKEMET